MTREIKDGKLYFDGCDTTQLAREYGTPLYVMSETDIIERFSQLRKEFTDKYPKTRVAYACKAFCNMAMLKPVSYTHLDVYKRQLERHSASIFCTASRLRSGDFCLSFPES